MTGVRGAVAGTLPGVRMPISRLGGPLARPVLSGHGEQSLGWLGGQVQKPSTGPAGLQGAPCCLAGVLPQCYRTGQALETKQMQDLIHFQRLFPLRCQKYEVPACAHARTHRHRHTHTHT